MVRLKRMDLKIMGPQEAHRFNVLVDDVEKERGSDNKLNDTPCEPLVPDRGRLWIVDLGRG